MTEDGYELIVARPAARAIAEALPEPFAAAVIDRITDYSKIPVASDASCENELVGIHSDRRGSYRGLHRIDESERTVTVLRVDHRGHVHRTT